MAKYTHEQLVEWYQNFSKILYEEANIDVTKKEDLGRIKNYYILNWDENQPTGPEVDFHYAFMPCNGHEYVNPAPSFTDFQAYSRWMMDNLDPQMNDERIEQLMEMSKAGTLMVFNPGSSDGNMRQVYTDPSGKIIVSLPMMEYMQEGAENIPPELRAPEIPMAAYEPDPEAFGLTGMPEKPIEPENMNPGFWSWVGYKLGMDTDYARMVRYLEEKGTYDDRFRKWMDSLDDSDPNVIDYKTRKTARENYLQEFEAFRANHLGLARAIDDGYRGYMMAKEMEDGSFSNVDRQKSELEFLMEQHEKLPQGMIDKKLKEVERLLQNAGRTDIVVRNLMGNKEPNYNEFPEWCDRGYIDPQVFTPPKYDLPKHPNDAAISKEEREAHREHLKSLVDITSYAALADPKVSGKPPRPGLTEEEVSKQNYTMILQNVFTAGRNNTRHLMPNLLEAREVGKNALEAYNNGDVKPMATLLANALRQTNREAACLYKMGEEHSMNTLHLVGKLYKALADNKELMDAAGLTAEELRETQANIELHKIMTKGLEGKKAILEHALYKRNLTREELLQAGQDVMFANAIGEAAKDQYTLWTAENERRDEHKALEEEMVKTAVAGTMEQQAEAAEKSNAPNAQELRENAQKMRNAHQTAISKLALEDFRRPLNPASAMLLDKEWVEHTRQQMKETCNLEKMIMMDRTALGGIFRSNAKMVKEFGPVSSILPKKHKQEISKIKEHEVTEKKDEKKEKDSAVKAQH